MVLPTSVADSTEIPVGCDLHIPGGDGRIYAPMTAQDMQIGPGTRPSTIDRGCACERAASCTRRLRFFYRLNAILAENVGSAPGDSGRGACSRDGGRTEGWD